MPVISRNDFEEAIRKMVEKTGLPEETVRKEAEKTASVNGYQIEESDVYSLLEHFSKSIASA